eukprot:g2122.t1
MVLTIWYESAVDLLEREVSPATSCGVEQITCFAGLVCLDGGQRCGACRDSADCPSKFACATASGEKESLSTGAARNADRITGPSKNTMCISRSLLLDFSVTDLFCTLFVAATAFLSAGSGVGGGGVFVPLFLMMLGFRVSEAVPLSKACCLTGSLVNILMFYGATSCWSHHIFLPEKNPILTDKPLIDFEVIAILNPPLLAGITLGVIGHKMSPDWLVVVLLLSTLWFAFTKSWGKGVEKWREETRDLLQGDDAGETAEIGVELATRNAAEDGDRARDLDLEDGGGVLDGTSVERHQSPTNTNATRRHDEGSPAAAVGPRPGSVKKPASASRSPVTQSQKKSTPMRQKYKRMFGRAQQWIAVSGFDADDDDTESQAAALDDDEVLSSARHAGATGAHNEGGLLSSTDILLHACHQTWLSAKTAIRITLSLCFVLFVLETTKATRCSGTYWLQVLTQLVICVGVGLYALRQLVAANGAAAATMVTLDSPVGSEQEEQEDVDDPLELERRSSTAKMIEEDGAQRTGELELVPVGKSAQEHVSATSLLFPLYAAVAGFVGGFLGIGGGMIISPVLLDLGLLPEVTQATTAAFVFLSSALAVIQFFLLDLIMPSYVLWYGFWVMVATASGQFILKQLLKTYGRKSLIILSVAAIIFLSMILMTGHGVWKLYLDVVVEKDWDALQFRFSKFCH